MMYKVSFHYVCDFIEADSENDAEDLAWEGFTEVLEESLHAKHFFTFVEEMTEEEISA